MKRLLILFALALSAWAIGAGDSNAQTNLTGCAFATVQTFDNFKHTDAGGRVGFVVPLDEGRGLYLRAVGTQVDLGDQTMSTFQPVVMLRWYVGKNWDIWWTAGKDFYISGPDKGSDALTGFGLSRRIVTFKGAETPAVMHGFVEISATDASGAATGSYAQINIGITLGPASK